MSSTPNGHNGREQVPDTERERALGESEGPRGTDNPAGREQEKPGHAPEPENEPGHAGRTDRVAAHARRWQRELAELGGPNTLLWHSDSADGDLELTTAHPGGVSMLMAGRATRLSDLVRERSAFEEACRRVELIRSKAIELEEERGLRTCFMAIGMATWSVTGKQRRACAPVLIRSCTLHPVNPAHTDYDIDLGGELDLNPVLVNFLATRGIEVDAPRLVDLAYASQRFDPQPVFREISRLAASLPELTVVDRKVVSTFSPAKLPMIADLAELGGALADHEVIAALAADPGARSLLSADEVPEPQGDIPAVRELLVLDADSRQTSAIDAVRSGINIAVTGAPGTGRTQTVANIVATQVADGKRVLVVSSKRTALVDLHRRLAECELGDLILDLPDGAHSPGAVSRSYLDSLRVFGDISEPDFSDSAAQLDTYRDRLSSHRDYLHNERRPWGVSVFDALSARSRLARRATPPTSEVRLDGATLRGMDSAGCESAARLLKEAAAAGAWSGGADDPWAGARVEDKAEAKNVGALVHDLAGSRLSRDGGRLDEIFAEVGLAAAATPNDWGEAVAVCSAARGTLQTFSPQVYSADLDALVGATADREYREKHGITLGWWARNALTRRAKELLLPESGNVRLHDALTSAADQRARWDALGGSGQPQVPAALDEAARLWNGLAADLDRLDDVLQHGREGGELLSTPVDALAERLDRLDASANRLAVLPTVTPLLDRLTTLGLRPLVTDLAARGVGPEESAEEMDHVWWESILDAVTAEEHESGKSMQQALTEYARLDTQYIRMGGRRVAARASARMRQSKVVYADQAAYLAGQARLQRHQVRPRELVGYTADALLAARPVWTMSPLVVAATVPPGQWFDLVIIEGAEQISTAEAVSAIARAGQVVVVGDHHGLAPTGFELVAAVPEPGDIVSTSDEKESVLTALTGVLPEHRLIWQYGCEDERIIGFANLHEYDGELITFPSTATEPPLRLVAVAPPEEQPGGESEQAEPDLADLETAEVVRLALEHARTTPERSLGVVTVSPEHSHQILIALRHRLEEEADPVVLSFFEAQEHSTDGPEGEPFFVKNLERVGGDQRDEIIFSVGSAAGQDGRALHRAGPLGLDGGERRLNAVVTASRSRLTVVTSLRPDDLDGGRMTSRGAQALHDLIAYAESGGDRELLRRQAGANRPSNVRPLRSLRRADEDDALLADFALQLRKEGLVVHERLGTSRAPVDLAVEDPYTPGRLVVAVESDGRRYAEADSTRERERLRPEQLTALGWEHVRVWSEDVATDPGPDVARVIEAIRSADARAARSTRRPGRTHQGHLPSDLW